LFNESHSTPVVLTTQWVYRHNQVRSNSLPFHAVGPVGYNSPAYRIMNLSKYVELIFIIPLLQHAYHSFLIYRHTLMSQLYSIHRNSPSILPHSRCSHCSYRHCILKYRNTKFWTCIKRQHATLIRADCSYNWIKTAKDTIYIIQNNIGLIIWKHVVDIICLGMCQMYTIAQASAVARGIVYRPMAF